MNSNHRISSNHYFRHNLFFIFNLPHMIIDLSTLQKEHTKLFKHARETIRQSHDELKRQRYFFTFAEKEGAWFDPHVNLVLRQDAHSGECFLFLEKTAKMRGESDLTPSCQSTNLIEINRIKLIARKKKNLSIVIMNQKQELQQIKIKFTSEDEQIAGKWENLIYKKRNSSNQVDNNDRVDLSAELKDARDQLIQQRRQKDEILKHLSIMTEQLINCKNSNSLLETQINEVMRSTYHANSIEFDYRRIQKLEDLCRNKQTELHHLKLKVYSLQKHKESFQSICHKMEIQLKGCQQQMNQVLNDNSDLRDKIRQLQNEKHALIDKLLVRNEQIRSNETPATKSVMIDNRQDLVRSLQSQSVLNSQKY